MEKTHYYKKHCRTIKYFIFLFVFANYHFILLFKYIWRFKKESDEDSFIFPSRNPELERQLGMKIIFRGGILYVILTMVIFLSAPFWIILIQ